VPFEQVNVGDLLLLTLVPVLGRIALGDAVLPVSGDDPRAVSSGRTLLGV
jgi:hypothetical protein